MIPTLLLAACGWWIDEEEQAARLDADGDGYVAAAHGGDDCDDGDAAVNPGVAEEGLGPDDKDNDCDGMVDECVTDGTATWHSEEVCDGLDNDCDGLVDEEGGIAWYPDGDGDGFTTAERPETACDPPSGYAAASDEPDCDDGDGGVYPGAEETCGDGVDQDCDGQDEACPARSLATAQATVQSEADGAELGCVVAGGLDRDGQPLMAVGARLGGEASVYLYRGALAGTHTAESDADAVISGARYSDTWDALALGSLRPGNTDLVVGARAADAVYLFDASLSGAQGVDAAWATYFSESFGGATGMAVAVVEQADDAGVPALLIGGHQADLGGNDSGAAWIVYEPVEGTHSLAGADARLLGEASYDYAGRSVADAGDVDGDGIHDLLIGAFGFDSGQ
ncbi:MAG: MopE-related protein [Pseudomonadota bacterium]